MKTLRVLMAALAAVLVLSALAASEEAPRKTAEELKAMLGAPGLLVLDVRTSSDWKSSTQKIKGAVREDPLDVDSWAGKYPKDQTMVLY